MDNCNNKFKKTFTKSEQVRNRTGAEHLAKSNPILSCEFICGLVSSYLDGCDKQKKNNKKTQT